MQKMAVSNILISGLKGLGVEIGIFLTLLISLLCEPLVFLWVLLFFFLIQRRFCLLFFSIAKNVVLGGVKSVTLHDTGSVELSDLSSQVQVTYNIVIICSIQTMKDFLIN